jgi:hypothetical protein
VRTVLPLHWLAPRVHWLVQAWQLPAVQTDIGGQVLPTQLVHMVVGSSRHSSRPPFVVQRFAPAVQAFWQHVEVCWAIWLSALVSAAWFEATYAEPVPPALAMASSTALLLPLVRDWSKPTTYTLTPWAKRAPAAAAVLVVSRQSFAPRPQHEVPTQVLVLGQPGVVVAQVAGLSARLQLGRPSVMSSTYLGAVVANAVSAARACCSDAAVGVPPPGPYAAYAEATCEDVEGTACTATPVVHEKFVDAPGYIITP